MRYLILETRPEGFFSNFMLIAGSLCRMYDNDIKEFNIIWKNPLYQTSDYNMFDKYFYKQEMYSDFNVQCTAHDLSVSMFSFVTPIEVFRKLNMVMNHYGCFNNKTFTQVKTDSVEKSNTLGVHVRRTDHARHGELLSDEYYFSKIDENLKSDNYDNIFLATDDSDVVLKFKTRYGDKIFWNEDITRLNGNIGIHYSNQPNKEKLAYDVMRDGLSMSKCKKLLGTASNVDGYALTVNPTIEYDQIDKNITFLH